MGAKRVPAVIFVTAYDQYAVEAFDANAIDYLLKPFGKSRFERALTRVREGRVRAIPSGGRAGAALDAIHRGEGRERSGRRLRTYPRRRPKR